MPNDFFATAHGKSACDGIGGSIKRRTSHESLRRPASNPILNATDMAEYCKATFPNIIIDVITSEDYEAASSSIKNRVNSSSTLDGTRGFHSFEHVGQGKIGAKIISYDEEFDLVVHHCPILSTNISEFSEQNYVAFVYDRRWYVGLISAVNKDTCELQINSMHPSGPATSFFWPNRLDCVWVPLAMVLTKIECPTLYSSRGSYKLAAGSERKIIQQWNFFLNQ